MLGMRGDFEGLANRVGTLPLWPFASLAKNLVDILVSSSAITQRNSPGTGNSPGAAVPALVILKSSPIVNRCAAQCCSVDLIISNDDVASYMVRKLLP